MAKRFSDRGRLIKEISDCLEKDANNALRAMGAAKSAFAVNTSRQGIIYIPVLFLLGAIWGINGLARSQPISDILSTAPVVTLYFFAIKSVQSKAA